MADTYLGNGAGTNASVGGGFFGVIFNWTGAIMSVALIGGLASWGYQLAMRDVTGVPVVRALAGPMRIAPTDPGGVRAAHQGLSVNTIAAAGAAERPADRLILAPAQLNLAAEDLPRPKLEEPAAEAEILLASAETMLNEGDVLALADSLSTDVMPLSGAIMAPEMGGDSFKVIPATIRGIALSPLPRPRPNGDAAAEAIARSVVLASASPADIDVDAGSLPVGTRLVQFGAFDTEDEARTAWVKMDAKFPDFLAQKQRVIQLAESGGKMFYRLRAIGFTDIDDARRFCSALLAERQACIPVVTR